MIRKTIAAAAHVAAAAALVASLTSIFTVEQADAAPASYPAVAPVGASVLALASGTGSGGNTGTVTLVPVGTVGQGGNTSPVAA